MKNIHQINKVLVIINVILGFTIYFGLLFLILLGIAQIFMSVIIAFNRKKLTKEINLLFNIYVSITTLIITSFFFMSFEFIPNQEGAIYLILFISVGMAFLHLKITHMINKKLMYQQSLNQ